MDMKIWRIIKFVRGGITANYIEVKQKQNRVRQLRNKYFMKQDVQDKRYRIMQDLTMTSYMIGIKDLLDTIFFNDDKLNFSHIIENVSNRMPDGVFSNSIIYKQVKLLNVPLEDMKNFILPADSNQFNSLRNNLVRLSLRYSMINGKGEGNNAITTSLNRIMPLIKKDGTFFPS